MSLLSPQGWVCFGISIVSTPLYVWILVTLVAGRKRAALSNTFYVLTMFQGIVDLTAMANYWCFTANRAAVPFWRDFLWNANRTYWAAWCYVHIYCFFFLRILGILAITAQRYVAVCHYGSRLDKAINDFPQVLIFAVVLLSAALLTPIAMCEGYFTDSETMTLKIVNLQLARNQIMGNATIFVCFTLCMFCYASIIVHVKRVREKDKAAVALGGGLRRAELSLTLQSLGLAFALSLMTLHYVLMLTLVTASAETLDFVRAFYPIKSCILSYTAPWTMLLFNGDLRKRLVLVGGSTTMILKREKLRCLSSAVWVTGRSTAHSTTEARSTTTTTTARRGKAAFG